MLVGAFGARFTGRILLVGETFCDAEPGVLSLPWFAFAISCSLPGFSLSPGSTRGPWPRLRFCSLGASASAFALDGFGDPLGGAMFLARGDLGGVDGTDVGAVDVGVVVDWVDSDL